MATNNSINCRTQGVVRYDGAGVFDASTLTQYSPLVGGAANAIVSLGPLTNGQIVIGSTGAQPVVGTITPGTGVGVVNGAGTITINAIGGGLIWTDVTGATQAIAVNNGYTANRGTLITFTLPVSSVYGSVIQIVGKGAGLWTIAQNASQMIHFGAVTSTTGVGGSVSSILQYDVIKLVCSVQDLEWTCVSAVGNFSIV